MLNMITGGAGFIGSHLCEYLLSLGEEVLAWDNLSTGSIKNLAGCIGRPGFSYRLTDFSSDRNFPRELERCDRVFHLAAAVGVRRIVMDPVQTIVTNVQGTEFLLRHAAVLGKRVLLASTSEVYGKGTHVPFAEEDDVVYGPTSRSRWSYGISKAVDEFLLIAYFRSHGLPGVIARLFNTVGPRQVPYYGMVVPQFVNQALDGGPITVYGSGKQTRCFAHVLDVVPALVALSRSDAALGQVVNIGSTEEITILNLAERIKAAVSPKVEIVFVPYERAYESGFEDMERRVPDTNKAKQLIGFAPQRDLTQIIADSVQYERRKRHG